MYSSAKLNDNHVQYSFMTFFKDQSRPKTNKTRYSTNVYKLTCFIWIKSSPCMCLKLIHSVQEDILRVLEVLLRYNEIIIHLNQ